MVDRPRVRNAIDWRAAVYAGIAAGVVATWAELLLWWLFAMPLPAILYRDARLAAAMVMGPRVLPPPASFDAAVMAAATVIHFVLSVVYAVVLAPLITRRAWPAALGLGAAFGLVLFVVNMYGFTWLFPWFSATRDGITLASHGVFGATAAFCYWGLSRRHRSLYHNAPTTANGAERHGDRTG
jgi:hypothetical protein